MAVNCLKLTPLMLSLLLCASCSANSEPGQVQGKAEVLDHLAEQFRGDIAKLESEIERCADLAQSKPVEDLYLIAELESSYGKEALLDGIGHLHFRNQLACEHSARANLAYTFGTLRTVIARAADWPEDIKSFHENLIYPDRREIEFEIRYRELPLELRVDLEAILGDQPFDLLKVIDEL